MNNMQRAATVQRLMRMNLIRDGYELPRTNPQAILTSLAKSIADLQRRAG